MTFYKGNEEHSHPGKSEEGWKARNIHIFYLGSHEVSLFCWLQCSFKVFCLMANVPQIPFQHWQREKQNKQVYLFA